MNQFIVTPSIKEDKNFASFRFNQHIDIEESIQFNSVEETKESPLAQQLFYLPFVKSVLLFKDRIELERFDILAWEDVLNEVTQEIQNFLRQGGQILSNKSTQKIPVTIYAESTPNPNVMKFVANKPLVDQIYEFKNIEESKEAPLASALFNFPFVKEIFIDANYLSVTKTEATQWENVVMETREFIRSYIEKDQPIVNQAQKSTLAAPVKTKLEDLDATSKEIVKIIDDYIKPAVASDGGNILFDSYNPQEKTVQVILQGACSGCPSSTFTLKNGIENMLKEMLPGKVATVSALNG